VHHVECCFCNIPYQESSSQDHDSSALKSPYPTSSLNICCIDILYPLPWVGVDIYTNTATNSTIVDKEYQDQRKGDIRFYLSIHTHLIYIPPEGVLHSQLHHQELTFQIKAIHHGTPQYCRRAGGIPLPACLRNAPPNEQN